MEDKDVKQDWVQYFAVTSYEWDCPLCSYTNSTKEIPEYRKLRCLKCGSYFKNVRDGGFVDKSEY